MKAAGGNMSEYIKREDAVRVIKNYGKGAISDGLTALNPVDVVVTLANAVERLSAEDVEPIYSDRCEIEVGSTYFNVWSSGTSEAAKQFYSVVRAADKIKFVHVPHEECDDEEFDDDMDKMKIIFVVNFDE